MSANATPYLDLPLIGHAGARRAGDLAQADRELEVIIDELERVRDAGGRINIKLAADVAGVARGTIYARLRARAGARKAGKNTKRTTNRGGPR